MKANDRTVTLTEVRLIGADGEQLGVVSYAQARDLAAEAGLDLVMVSDRSTPPVVRIMNFGKLRYEQKKNLKAQRRNTAAQKLKEKHISGYGASEIIQILAFFPSRLTL